MEELFRTKTEVRLKSKETLAAYGRFDDNVYVMKSGIIRYCYFDGIRERTFGFAMPGSVMIQYHCHFMRKPSFFQPEACGETVVMKIARRDFDALIARSHEFSNWMLSKYSLSTCCPRFSRFLSLFQIGRIKRGCKFNSTSPHC